MAEQRYVFKESTIKAIIDIPRSILDIDEEQKFPPTEFSNMIGNAISYVSESAYQGGLSQGHNEGYNEGYGSGYSTGQYQLVQNSESLQATAVGTSLVLDDISPIGHEMSVKVAPKNLFDISKVIGRTASSGLMLKNNNDGTITVTAPLNSSTVQGASPNTLKDYAPNLEAGREYRLSFDTTGTTKHIYLSSGGVWTSGTTKAITQEMLSATVYWYASGASTTATISNIKIEDTNNLPIVEIAVSDNNSFNNAIRHTSKTDGTFDRITSIYPTTFISTDITNDNFVIECNYVKDIDKAVETSEEQGRQQAYDEFWDSYQQSGTLTNYQYAFAGYGWNDTNFWPKYDIILTAGYTGTNMFWSNAVSSLKQRLIECEIILDTSKSQYMSSMFQSIVSSELPTINMSNCDLGATYTFSSPNIVTIDEIVFSEKTNIATSTFNNATKLTSVLFSGIIAKTIDLHWSTLLDKASIVSLFNTLSTTTTGLTLTLSKTAVNNAFETSEGAADGSTSAEWLALTGTRTNWTIALA